MLKDKVIFIAGACGRIGSALSKELLEQNARLVLTDINEANLSKLTQGLRGEFLSVRLDITSKESLESAISQAVRHFAKIDGFVNASYPCGKDWGKVGYYEASFEQICESLNLHLGGFILAANAFVKFFKKQGYGNIINLSSIMGVYAPKFENYAGTSMQSSLEYSVIKAGINHLGVWMAKELFNTNIRVNTLASGGILDNQVDSFLKAYRKCCASKGMLEAGDVCGMIAFLLSDKAKFITGQTLVVADGWGL